MNAIETWITIPEAARLRKVGVKRMYLLVNDGILLARKVEVPHSLGDWRPRGTNRWRRELRLADILAFDFSHKAGRGIYSGPATRESLEKMFAVMGI